MTYTFSTLFCLALFVTGGYGQDKFQLEVRVTQLKAPKGEIQVCIFSSSSTFMKDANSCQRREVRTTDDLLFQFDDLSTSTFAATVIHDVNNNGKLDLGFLKIPKEPYGFSNNPSTTFGPPSFDGASFPIEKDTTITIEL